MIPERVESSAGVDSNTPYHFTQVFDDELLGVRVDICVRKLFKACQRAKPVVSKEL